MLQASVQPIKENAGESGDFQQRDLSVDNGGVFEILRDLPLVPHLLEEHCESVHQLGSAMLANLSMDRVLARCFPAGELLHGSDGFLERGREIKVGIDFHFRQAIDGGVGDGGGLFKNAQPLNAQRSAHRVGICVFSVSSVLSSVQRRGAAPLTGVPWTALVVVKKFFHSFQSVYPWISSALRSSRQTSHNVVPDGKGNIRVASLCLWLAAPEEGVAGTHLLQLALLGELGLAESSNIYPVEH
ncbi:unnamed protein product [Schistocephalus solidus]|uniref:Uncharacterized protein n=1 Tax=Schistocephalus solidus TaxID=70667 RepID=A0A3P7BZR5_SCHSO|nr:unnamed protein product [Schistocephalus solidus]